MYLRLNFSYTHETIKLPEFRNDMIDIVSWVFICSHKFLSQAPLIFTLQESYIAS